MNQTMQSRKDIYAFLYRQRVENPKMFFDRADLARLAPCEQVEAVISFGRELGHLEVYRKHYFRLTAQGILFVETNRWVEED